MSQIDDSALQPRISQTLSSGESSVPWDAPFEGAGFWIRTFARVIDLVIRNLTFYVVGNITVAILVIVFLVAGMSDDQLDLLVQEEGSNVLINLLLSLLLTATYHTLCEGLHGATLGKLVFGLVAIKDDGSPCSLRAAFYRSLVFPIDSLFFGLVAASKMRESPKNQRYGDKWAGTMVVKRRNLQPAQLRPGWLIVVAFLATILVDGLIAVFVTFLKLVR